MAFWADLFKLFSFALEPDPLSKQQNKNLSGAGVTQPDAIPDIRQDSSYWGGGGGKGLIRLRDSNDFVDLSTVSNRQSRYKEYERLRSVAEIETAMDVFADESCLSGETKISTVFYGLVSIRWLEQNKKNEEIAVYCWDEKTNDYTIGWAYDPRIVKKSTVLKIALDDGKFVRVTEDHRILMRDGTWKNAGNLEAGDLLMPFYRIEPHTTIKRVRNRQFPRIFTFIDGWKHERQFIDEWRTGIKEKKYERVNAACRLLASGIGVRKASKIIEKRWLDIQSYITAEGFTALEVKNLGKNLDRRKVLYVIPQITTEVYDLSVRKYENFCGESIIFHNCQKGDNGHIFDIQCKDDEVKKELEFACFNRDMWNFDRTLWDKTKRTYIKGDHFIELVIDPERPADGVLKLQSLPPESMFRIETTKGRVVEFQQSKEGPDYESLARTPVAQATDAEIQQSTALRFAPDQIVHIRIGDDRETFYPYGISLIEAARGPAYQLKLQEDAMLVYRLCISGYERIRTKSGWKYIKDIVPEDIVWSYDDGYNAIESKVTWIGKTGIKPTYTLLSKHTQITGTADHPILIRNKETGDIDYAAITDIKPKQHQVVLSTCDIEVPKKIDRVYTEPYARLSIPQKTEFKNKIYSCQKKALIVECLEKMKLYPNKNNIDKIWAFLVNKNNSSLTLESAHVICDTFGLKKDDLIIHNHKERTPERINLPEYVNEDFASLFGFLLGDGCLNYNGRCAKVLFSTGQHEDINQKYKILMKKYFGKVSFRQDKRKNKGIGEYCSSSVTACDILKNLGYICGAKYKRIPSWVFNERKEIRKAIVRGLADADGGKRGYQTEIWYSAIRLHNEQLIHDIKELWTSIGLCSGKIKKRWADKRFICGMEVPAAFSWEIRIVDKPLPQYDDIVSVEFAGEQEVYDLGVKHEARNFIANGMVVKNCRAPERRMFYIDTGTLPPYKAEAFVERMKDMFRKKKVATTRGNVAQGSSSVEERWHPPAVDEDYWIPIRPNSNTRIETLPGATNLGEVDDVIYFRNKLFTALKFPKNYLSNEDIQATRMTLSAQDCRFARMIERLQTNIEDAIWQICDRHLRLLGYPKEKYEDLKIKMTPPSDWREMSRAEVITSRINNAGSLKGSMLMSDYDILTRWMKFEDKDAKSMISRMKMQKLEDLKIQVLANNPQLLGVGVPGAGETEVGATPEGPNPMLSPEGGQPQLPAPPEGGMPEGGQENPPPTGHAGIELPEPSTDDLKKYDMQVQTYSKEADFEEIDFSVER